MNIKKNLSILFFLTSTLIFSQKKDNLYLLTETGIQNTNNEISLQFGAGIEYSFSKKSSLTARIKYLRMGIKTEHGVNPNNAFGFNFNPYYKMHYEGEVISIPLNYKWESRFLFPKLHFFFNTGFALNFTLNEQFLIAKNITPDIDNKTYINFNLGLGFSHTISKRFDLYLSMESFFFGGAKSIESKGFIVSTKLTPSTSTFNLGLRYRLKRKK